MPFFSVFGKRKGVQSVISHDITNSLQCGDSGPKGSSLDSLLSSLTAVWLFQDLLPGCSGVEAQAVSCFNPSSKGKAGCVVLQGAEQCHAAVETSVRIGLQPSGISSILALLHTDWATKTPWILKAQFLHLFRKEEYIPSLLHRFKLREGVSKSFLNCYSFRSW